MWPAIHTIGCITVWSLISLQLTWFVITRCNSISRQVHVNIEQFHRTQAEQLKRQIDAAVQRTRCQSCSQLLSCSAYSQDDAAETSSGESVVLKKHSVNQMNIVTGSTESIKRQEAVLNISRTKNLVSKLTKKFENGGISPNVIDTSNQNNSRHKPLLKPAPVNLPNSYFAYKNTDFYEVSRDNKSSTGQTHSFRNKSNSIGRLSDDSFNINLRQSEKEFEPVSLRNSINSIQEQEELSNGEVQFRERSHSFSDVRTVEDILKQERFSKCFSDYSISDLLDNLSSDEDGTNEEACDLTLLLQHI